ncbi:hypothetical protein ACLOJK_009051 [Asimina triloba]
MNMSHNPKDNIVMQAQNPTGARKAIGLKQHSKKRAGKSRYQKCNLGNGISSRFRGKTKELPISSGGMPSNLRRNSKAENSLHGKGDREQEIRRWI